MHNAIMTFGMYRDTPVRELVKSPRGVGYLLWILEQVEHDGCWFAPELLDAIRAAIPAYPYWRAMQPIERRHCRRCAVDHLETALTITAVDDGFGERRFNGYCPDCGGFIARVRREVGRWALVGNREMPDKVVDLAAYRQRKAG